MAKERIHVTPHKDGWQVRTEGRERATTIQATQAQAISKGREIAISRQTELIIHGRDGKIRNSNSFGNDPCPPKDRK